MFIPENQLHFFDISELTSVHRMNCIVYYDGIWLQPTETNPLTM